MTVARSERLQLRIDPGLKRKLQAAADASHRDLSPGEARHFLDVMFGPCQCAVTCSPGTVRRAASVEWVTD